MIGQENLRKQLEELARKGKLPRFTILVGGRGMGKTTLAKEVYSYVSMFIDGNVMAYEVPDVRIETIRDMIKQAYTITEPVVYVISDADDMSVGAKNALLKVTEEPPNNAYFIMTLNDLNNTLETIKSRGTVFTLAPYNEKEKATYLATLAPNTKQEDKDLILQIADNFYDIRQLLADGVQDMYQYVEKVVDNIAEVSGANAFKIASKVATKSGEEGYELELFFKLFQHICLQRLHESTEEVDKDRYLNGITITNHNLLSLSIRGVNRQFVIDSWILEIRRSWM